MQHATCIIDFDNQKIFSYATSTTWALQAVAVVAACGSGVALAMVNIVLGNFITLLSDFTSGHGISDDFMSLVTKQAYVPAGHSFLIIGAHFD